MQHVRPNFQIIREPFPKVNKHVLVECDFIGIEQRVLDHCRKEVADKCRADVLCLLRGVVDLNGGEQDGDTFRCAVFRENGKAIDNGEENPASVK